MTDREVLQKAIEIAIENGYLKGYIGDWNILPRSDGSLYFENFGTITQSIERLIFSHDFAKNFWGEEWVTDELASKNTKFLPVGEPCEAGIEYFGKLWQYHLQQMVIYSNPIDYLRKFIVQETKK